MCGIYGYIGEKNASEIIINGLKRLDYRGYDSWGVGLQNENIIHVFKKKGVVQNVNHGMPKAKIGIGHTRWATHGAVSDINAHPHTANNNHFTLAQNGIVENYEELKKKLIDQGYNFLSETDTEVIVHLIEEKMKVNKDILSAVRSAFLELKGRNTIILLTKDDEIIAARNGSPLVIGKNDMNEIFFSSDVLSFSHIAQDMLVIENGQMVYASNETIKLFDIKTFKNIEFSFEPITIQSNIVDKKEYEHFMLKEINETPQVIKQLLKIDKILYTNFAEALRNAETIYTIGSGSAGIAAAQMAFYLREYAGCKTISLVGADAQDYYHLFKKNDVIIAPSQSGETADVLEVLEIARKKGVLIATYVNMPGSMMTRMADFKFMIEAGPEICVMSTKVFTAQLAWGYLVAKFVQGNEIEGLDAIQYLTSAMQDYLDSETNRSILLAVVENLLNKHDIFLLGKYQNFQIMREGMVKLIEGTYKHAHAIPAGDLKHYAITLMEPGVPVIVALSQDIANADVVNAVNQVKARGAYVIGISSTPQEKFDWHIKVPETLETQAIINIIPLQLLAYYLAKALGNNIDKPRNIAKSVTVK